MFTLIGQYDRRIDPERTQLSVTRPDTSRAVERQDMPSGFGQGAQSYQPPKRQNHPDDTDDAATVSLEALRVNAVARLGQIDAALLHIEDNSMNTDAYRVHDSENSDATKVASPLAARAASAYQHAAGQSGSGSSPAPRKRDGAAYDLKAERLGLRSLIPRIDALLASDVMTVTVPRGESFSQAVERAFQALETDE